MLESNFDARRALEARLTRLERQNRQLGRGLLALAAGVCVAAGAGWLAPARAPKTPAVLTARRFVVRDARGRRRIELGVGRHSGSNYVRLYTRHGLLAAELAVWPRVGPALRLLDGRRTPRVDLSYLPGVGSSLELFDAHGHPHLVLLQNGRDRPSIRLSDAEGRGLLLGCARVRLKPKQPPERTPANSLLKLGARGRVLWQAP